MKQTVKTLGSESRIVEETDIAHLAGVIDGKSSITAYVAKDDGYEVGYRVNPTIQLSRRSDDEFLLGKLDAYCEEFSVNYSINEPGNGDRVTFCVIHHPSIERFLDPLMPYLTTEYPRASIMIEDILPIVRKKRHTTKEGLYKLVGHAERINQHGKQNRDGDMKYDQAYFEERWNL